MNDFNYKIVYKNILNTTVNSYLNQSKIHGLTPKGIHWQSHLTQNARFENLSKEKNDKELIWKGSSDTETIL